MKLNYFVLGENNKNVVALLHGLLGDGANLKSLAQNYLSNYKAYLPDHRNHGESPHDPEHNYYVMSEDLKELFDKEKISKAHVIGHSMGAKVAMKFTNLYPQLVDKLVIIDILPKKYAPYTPVFEAMAEVDLSVNERSSVIEALYKAFEADKRFAHFAGDISGEDLVRYMRGISQFVGKNLKKKDGGGFEWRVGLNEMLRNARTLSLNPEQNEIAPISHPTLIIRGLKSHYIQDEDVADLIPRFFNRAKLVSIEGAGHMAHSDKPSECGEAVAAFLNEE